MTVFIAKMLSRAHPAPFGSSAAFFPQQISGAAVFSWVRSIRKAYLTGIFLAVALFAAAAYVVAVNVMILEGNSAASQEAVLVRLEQEQKLKYTMFSASHAPLVIEQQATAVMHMTGVTDVRYLNGVSPVATRGSGLAE